MVRDGVGSFSIIEMHLKGTEIEDQTATRLLRFVCSLYVRDNEDWRGTICKEKVEREQDLSLCLL